MSVLFGTAGAPDEFAELGYKTSADAPEYIVKKGLDAFEYQCGQGVRVSEKTAALLGEKARAAGVALSLHAPYFISLSSVEEEKRLNSINYILQSAKAAKAMGAERIVIHSGSCSKMTREQALELASDTLKKAKVALIEAGFDGIVCCPETMGKINQLDTLDEVLELCGIDESFLPCVDFGHLNARTLGKCNSREAFAEILDKMENKLGIDRAKRFHSHFSKIEYTSNGGEKRHLTFEDELYGPKFEPLMDLLAQRDYSPTIICESDGTQGIDALKMKEYYINIQRRN